MSGFPFTAIVGQDELRQALLLACIDPTIGGVLAMGDRGTGKSTVIRALAALLPPMRVNAGCRFQCDPAQQSDWCTECRARPPAAAADIPVPVVDLPLGATEDRVVGALDLERALARGETHFQPGLLARAHRGFLYVDEVNLLEDHLVDLLIDVAASGENLVEREGLSLRHPARFVLVGSGNPEEGELRPQLLDRFGLSVDVRTPADIATRVAIIRRRDDYDRNPDAFRAAWAEQEAELRARLVAARAVVPTLALTDGLLTLAAQLCLALGTDGLRAELTLARAARALAALDAAPAITPDHLRAVAPAALRHRLRRAPLDEAGAGARIDRALQEVLAG
jgi:magnesium chelatase subunit I